MNFDPSHNFSLVEKTALLKLLIKVFASDKDLSEEERASIKTLLERFQLKISKGFIKDALVEKYDDILAVFQDGTNIARAVSFVEQHSLLQTINPNFEGKALDEIREAAKRRRESMRLGLKGGLAVFLREFGYLWGQEDLNPKIREGLAITFTLAACISGSLWTSFSFWKLRLTTEFVMPQASAVICGLLIFGALCVRNYLPRPSSVRNIFFSIADIYVLALVAMHILGRDVIEKAITTFIFFGLILLLWLGLKEIIGFFLLGLFLLLLSKLVLIDIHLAWRAFPFLICAFTGISFQSNNFFSEFLNISNSFFAKPAVEKQLIKESLQSAGSTVASAAKGVASAGVQVAKLSSGIP